MYPLCFSAGKNDEKPQVQVYLGLWYFVIEISDPFKFLTSSVCLDQQRSLCRLVTIDILAGISLVARSGLDFC